MRALCGCTLLDDLRTTPTTRAENDARTKLAHTLRSRWGCPRAGLTPPATLPPDLADEARYYAETTRTTLCASCPFSRDPSPWVREVLRVQRLSVRLNGSVSARDALGRAPHLWDVAALDALLLAQSEAEASDQRIAEAERAAKSNP